MQPSQCRRHRDDTVRAEMRETGGEPSAREKAVATPEWSASLCVMTLFWKLTQGENYLHIIKGHAPRPHQVPPAPTSQRSIPS